MNMAWKRRENFLFLGQDVCAILRVVVSVLSIPLTFDVITFCCVHVDEISCQLALSYQVYAFESSLGQGAVYSIIQEHMIST